MKKFKENEELIVEYIPPPAVSIDIVSITRNGLITLKFNQRLLIPDFVQKL